MPDGAFDSTERQFLELLGAGSGDEIIEVRRYVMAGVPRGERTSERIAREYATAANLNVDPPDLLIVTGSNPLQERIEDEPYWNDLVELLSWASGHVPSMLLSCLSAHAALVTFDGLERLRLATKCTGVFAQQVDQSHPLSSGLEPQLVLAHSRWNTVPADGLRDAGYRIPLHSDEVGWSVATREIAGTDVTLIQGHPEYDPSSLLREYRRDVTRYVLHERDDLPCLPLHCVAPEDWPALERLHFAVVGGRRDPELVDAYPFDDVAARAPWPWYSAARRLYANWLSGITKGSD
jgi:homoserine O-succinyltransferase